MKRLSFLGALVILALVSACSPSTKITGSWKAPAAKEGGYSNLFVTALTDKLVARQTIENDIDTILEEDGITANSSFEIIPPGFKATPENKEEVINQIKAAGHDAILTIALLDQTSETRYVPGSTMYSPMMYGGYYGSFYGYYSYYNPVMYDPGYYTTDKNYYIEMNLYDAQTEQLVWSAQSETTNPSSLESFSKTFAQSVEYQMVKDGLISSK
ncbi:hypothetical protein PBT90_06260 [Algoriphagus halophytocola]|uniref:DUF4136 domain-containing protein n=1 Tax=Algoriphagus halophytocola TaxID=2991499 RepID=A0ABY6MJZ3_9BACT|nr:MULTISPECIES: hypothetical protein [unclassified Algoriphagus]UZD22996.1 hypothetical protein OM944_00580 [Algoriphagus sp. TR-M5]WBL44287.1 hypothetical protein PBT90_06260 [Algoriphagus sp. TR-M9]